MPSSNNSKSNHAAQPAREGRKSQTLQLRKLIAAHFRGPDVLLEQVARKGTTWVGFEVYRKGGIVQIISHLPDAPLGLDLCPVDDDLVHKHYLQLPERSIPYGSTAQLLADLLAHFDRYVVFPPDMRLLIPLFVLYTWVYDRFPTAPALRFVGDMGNGKSRAVQVVGDVSYHTFTASGAASMASVFRSLETIGGGTLVMDELDFSLQKDEHHEMMRLLRQGFQKKGGSILRAEDTGSGYKAKAFDVFGPKILSGRKPFPDPALESRCLRVYMSPHVDLSSIPSELPDDHPYHAEAAVLRNKLLRWRYEHVFMPTREPARLPIEPRLFQLYSPLASVTDDPAALNQLKACVLKLHDEMTEDRRNSLEGRTASALHTCWERGEKRISLASLALFVGAEIDSKDVGAVVRAFGFVTKRASAGYVVRIDELTLMRTLERYGLAGSPEVDEADEV